MPPGRAVSPTGSARASASARIPGRAASRRRRNRLNVGPGKIRAGRSGSPVAHKMLIESDPHETRIAVLEEDRLTEIFLERRRHRGVVGNVYKGRVSRVLPGM